VACHAAKTVADCFKYRRQGRLDVAIEALQDFPAEKKATIREICFAMRRICRVSRFMRPYLEASV